MLYSGLKAPIAPPLPFAPSVYAPRYQDQLNNILRLYFARIDSSNSSLLGAFGGRYIDQPNGLFFSQTTQTPLGPNVATPVKFTGTYLTNGVSLKAPSQSEIVVDVSGVYNFQLTAQLESTNSSAKDVFIWIRRNDVALNYSAQAYTISGSGTKETLQWNFIIDLIAGQTLQMDWSSADTAVSLASIPAATPHPGVPSAVMSVMYVAPLPDPLPVPPAP